MVGANMRLISTLVMFAVLQYQRIGSEGHNLPSEIRTGYIYVQSKDGVNESPLAVISLAEKDLKSAQIIPSDVSFDLQYEYGICDNYNASMAYVKMAEYRNISVLFGPPCSTSKKGWAGSHGSVKSGDVIARLAVSYNMLLISHVLRSDVFEDKELYKTCARATKTSVSQIAGAMITLLKSNQWSRVALISYTDFYSKMLAIGMRKELKLHKFVIAADISYNNTRDDINESLQIIKSQARVIIAIFTWEFRGSLEVMQHAFKHNMTGPDYVWVIPELSFQKADLRPWKFLAKENNEIVEKSNSAIKDAYRGVVLVHTAAAHEQIAYNERFREEYTRIFPDRSQDDFQATDHQGQLYDSVYTYGVVLNMSDTEGINISDGVGLFNLLKWKKIRKPDNTNITYDGDVERVPRYHVHAFNQENRWSLVYMVLRTKDPENYKYKYMLIQNESFAWRTENNKPPKDAPPCGFDGGLCKTKTTEIVIGVGAAFLVIISAGIAYAYKRKMQADFLRLSWLIQADKILMGKQVDGSLGSSGLNRSSGSLGSHTVPGSTANSRHKQLGTFDGNRVVLSSYQRLKRIRLDREQLDILVNLKRLSHDNLVSFSGISLNDGDHVLVVWQYTSSRSLRDVLSNSDINLDDDFLATFIRGVSTGLKYIHRSNISYHGSLTSEKCLVDNRFVVKIADHGMDPVLEPLAHAGCLVKHHETFDLLHAAPEHIPLMLNKALVVGSKPADIYSLSLIFHQIITRRELYIEQLEGEAIPIPELLKQIGEPVSFPLRPIIPENVSHIWMAIINIIRKCWDHSPTDRPSIDTVTSVVNQATAQFSKNIIEEMIKRMEKYTSNLEKVVNERTEQVQAQQERSEKLLQQMLPKSVADRLQAGLTVEPEWYAASTILFTDIVQFTNLSAKHSPLEMVTLLNQLYSAFDEIIDTHDVYKVETIGDAYMVVSGVPHRLKNHAEHIVLLAIDMRNFVQSFKLPFPDDSMKSLQIRLGCHSGPVATGVVGLKMPRFCLFGDSVNTASRMESNGIPMKVQVTGDTKHELEDNKQFVVEMRGNIEIKGKGLQTTYFVEKKRGHKGEVGKHEEIQNI